MTRELGGKTYAQVLACIALAVSILFMRAFSMFQPVCFDILFWSLILYAFLRYINTEKPVYLILVGVAFGFGFLNKYMVVFLAAGLAISRDTYIIPEALDKQIFMVGHSHCDAVVASKYCMAVYPWLSCFASYEGTEGNPACEC